MALIEVSDLRKTYDVGEVAVPALRGVSFSIEKGEFVCLMGHSGSGKSTLMNILGCLDVPSSGTYLLDGTDVSQLSLDELAWIRNRKIGFVFQGFNLLPRMDAVENVELPMLYAGVPPKERRSKALEALERVGLAERAHHLPSQLSGGQQQRVAIARAIVNSAPLILADEPTGNLDTKNSEEVMHLFVDLNDSSMITIVLVTHEPDMAQYGKRTITIIDGLKVSDVLNPQRRK